MRSATILASTATRTDGLSKTAFVLGAEEAMKIYEKLDDVDAILVTPDGRVLYSKGLEPAAPPPSAPAARSGARAMKKLFWFGVALIGAYALGGIALHRGESINAMWIIVAAVCVYALGYRFYSAWVAARVLTLDATRATPAERLNNGRDFVPTNRWIVFGHHFAAIAGPGPLIGPTLAAQFGYLPGLLWILIGGVLGGCVQDMTILFLSTRRDGRSLGKMARDELGPVGGYAAMIGTLMILVILIAVLGLVVVNAMQHSPWATATVFATIPIAMLVGLYLRNIRPGRVIEASVHRLQPAAVRGGRRRLAERTAGAARLFDLDSLQLAWFVMGYGFIAAIVPVWLLLAPRDYLSTFLKIGTVILLAVAVVWMHPADQDAGGHAVHRRHRSGVRRQDLSVRVHHHRVRRDFGISRARVERHDAEADRQRTRRPRRSATAA